MTNEAGLEFQGKKLAGYNKILSTGGGGGSGGAIPQGPIIQKPVAAMCNELEGILNLQESIIINLADHISPILEYADVQSSEKIETVTPTSCPLMGRLEALAKLATQNNVALRGLIERVQV